MPYIRRGDRRQYFSIIENVLRAIPRGDPLDRAEYLGYFIHGLVKKILLHNTNTGAQNEFEECCVDEEVKNKIIEEVDNWFELPDTDITTGAVNLNYTLSTTIWGFLGDSTAFDEAQYGTRAYVHGILIQISRWIFRLEILQEDKRRLIMLQGVLRDVTEELYRRRTSLYEDQKIRENGDIWPLLLEYVDVEIKRDINANL